MKSQSLGKLSEFPLGVDQNSQHFLFIHKTSQTTIKNYEIMNGYNVVALSVFIVLPNVIRISL